MAWMGMLGAPGCLRNELERSPCQPAGWLYALLSRERERFDRRHIPQDARRHIAPAANGDHQLRLEIIQNAVR